MTRFGWTMVLGALLLIGAAFAAVWYSGHRPHAPAASGTMASTTPLDPSTLSIYTNGQYGFTFFYPAADAVTDAFSASSSNAAWRTNALATGTPVAMVTDPAGQVRIGASAQAKEKKACTQRAPAEYPYLPVTLGSTTFAAFMFDRIGTDNEQRIISYRAIHDGSCIAIELIAPLAKGATTSPALTGILHSFHFVRP